VAIISNTRGDNTPSAVTLAGVQYVPKFNLTTPDQVRVLMALFRVVHKDVDLVVTFNVPMKSQDDGAIDENGWIIAQAHFDAFIKSLRIVDFGLFV
jgi:hypothetical protein